MSVKLRKEHIKLSQVICARNTKTTVESDVIVPDIKPDAVKILKVCAEAVITQKSVQSDKVYVEGIIRLDILYVPEDRSCGRVKSISVDQSFNHMIAANGAKNGMNVEAAVVSVCPEYNLINSRKIGIRSTLCINIKVTENKELEIAAGVEDGEDIQAKARCLKFHNSCQCTERDVLIKDKIEVPQGKPDLKEILRFSIRPELEELRLLTGKAVVKGNLKICTLYSGKGEDDIIECMEHIVPFSEVLEIDGVDESLNGEAVFSVKDIYYEICRDNDGDKRLLSFETAICIEIKTTGITECETMCDAYSLSREVKMKKDCCDVEQLVDIAAEQISLKELAKVPDYLPEVYQVCDCTASSEIERVSIEGEIVIVTGYITTNVLYMSQSEEVPVSGFSHVLPFSHSVRVDGICENSVCDAKVEVEHLGYIISGNREIELRPTLNIGLKAVNPNSCEIVSEMEYDNEKEVPKRAAMIVYFVKRGDSLWDVAKRYRTTPEKIVAVNGSEKECMVEGNRIYIFK